MSNAVAERPVTRDPVGVADRLRTEVTERIRSEDADAGPPTSDVYVGWVAALEAATCPARYRASGAEGWGFPGWSPVLAGAAVGRAALARQLQISGPTAPLYPLEAVRGWVREMAGSPAGSVGEWIGELVRAEDRASLAAVAANATRWVAGFIRVSGWPLPEQLGLVDDGDGPYSRRWPKRWRPRLAAAGGGSGAASVASDAAGRRVTVADSPDAVLERRTTVASSPGASGPDPVARRRSATIGSGSVVRRGTSTVASSPDAVIGRVAPSGHFILLVHRPIGPGDGLAGDRAAFEAAAGALSCGIVAEEVVVATADSNERLRFPVETALLERGAHLVVEVVRQRALAQAEWDFTDATPSAACRHCPTADSCPSGQTWLAGPGRWVGGLPSL